MTRNNRNWVKGREIASRFLFVSSGTESGEVTDEKAALNGFPSSVKQTMQPEVESLKHVLRL